MHSLSHFAQFGEYGRTPIRGATPYSGAVVPHGRTPVGGTMRGGGSVAHSTQHKSFNGRHDLEVTRCVFDTMVKKQTIENEKRIESQQIMAQTELEKKKLELEEKKLELEEKKLEIEKKKLEITQEKMASKEWIAKEKIASKKWVMQKKMASKQLVEDWKIMVQMAQALDDDEPMEATQSIQLYLESDPNVSTGGDDGFSDLPYHSSGGVTTNTSTPDSEKKMSARKGSNHNHGTGDVHFGLSAMEEAGSVEPLVNALPGFQFSPAGWSVSVVEQIAGAAPGFQYPPAVDPVARVPPGSQDSQFLPGGTNVSLAAEEER